jgi:hypothetical protein
MAQGAAGVFQRIATTPGNPELPVLPDPNDPKGLLNDLFVTGAGITQVAFPANVLSIFSAGPGVANGFAQAYLNGIGGTPNPIDFGNITATKQAIVTVHNTFRFPVDVTAVDVSGVSGVTLLTPGLPISVPSFGSIVFNFEASLVGDPSFDALVEFTTDEGNFSIRMIGRRVVLFETVPQRPIPEQLTFGSDIMQSVDGSEQVMSWRTTPRSRVTYVIRFTDNKARTSLYNQILGAGFLLQGVQLWFQARQLTSAALAVDTVLQIDTTGMEIAATDTLSIVLTDLSAITAEVDTFDATSITLTAAVGIPLPRDTFVMPIRFGYMQANQRLATFALNAEDLRVTFDLIEYDNIGNVDPAFFDAHPVDGLPIPKQPLFFDGQSRGGRITSATDRLDSRTGQIFAARSEVLGRPRQDMLVHCPDFATTHAWRTFLHAQRGAWGRFYVPTGTNDLPLFNDLALGGNTIDIQPMGVTNLLGNVAPRRDVRVTVAGVSHDRRITLTADNVTFETLTLDSVIPGAGAVPPADVKIEWLSFVRLVGDSATFQHVTLGTSELRFSVRGVIEI